MVNKTIIIDDLNVQELFQFAIKHIKPLIL